MHADLNTFPVVIARAICEGVTVKNLSTNADEKVVRRWFASRFAAGARVPGVPCKHCERFDSPSDDFCGLFLPDEPDPPRTMSGTRSSQVFLHRRRDTCYLRLDCSKNNIIVSNVERRAKLQRRRTRRMRREERAIALLVVRFCLGNFWRKFREASLIRSKALQQPDARWGERRDEFYT